jgi:hypothetical protein
MVKEPVGVYYDHDQRRRIQVMTYGEFEKLAKESKRMIYPYEFEKLDKETLGIVDGLTFTILEFTYLAERAIKEGISLTIQTSKNVMCFPSSGYGNEEFTYLHTDFPPACTDCSFRHNYKEVAPCFDCVAYNNTGRSYFQSKFKGVTQ